MAWVKQKVPDGFENQGDEQFVQQCAKEESRQLGYILPCSILHNTLEIYVPVKEVVDRFVPEPVELLKGGTVPPLIVELSICELGYLPEHIQDILEYNVEEQNQEDGNGEHSPEDEFHIPVFASLLDEGHDVVAVDDVGGYY